MKTLYKIFVILFLAATGFTACTDDLMITNKGDQPLILSASDTVIVLDVTVPESNALTLNWTAGSNFNTNASISYSLELAIKGTDFATTWHQDCERGITSVSLTTEELNTLLIQYFGVTPSQEAELEARVTAVVHADGIEPQVSEVITLKVSTYRAITKTLYLIGDATPNGWSADNATKMNSITGIAGGFTWQGRLSAGELKFITTLGAFTPSYNKGDDDTKLYFRESGDDPYDEKFVITTGGVYRITLNIITLAIQIEALEAPEFGELWLIGNATGAAYKPMTMDFSDPFIFHYNADLGSGGRFKIAAQEAAVGTFFRPETDGKTAGTNMNVVKGTEDPDYQWNVTAGVYKIKLDVRDLKIDIVKFTPYAMIYLVGNATPNGWEINQATPMVAGSDPYTFTWTGHLVVGELKFTCDKQSDWGGAWFLASQSGIEPSGNVEQMIFSAHGDGGHDNKWNVKTAGTYSIELNQLQETVIITKQ